MSPLSSPVPSPCGLPCSNRGHDVWSHCCSQRDEKEGSCRQANRPYVLVNINRDVAKPANLTITQDDLLVVTIEEDDLSVCCNIYSGRVQSQIANPALSCSTTFIHICCNNASSTMPPLKRRARLWSHPQDTFLKPPIPIGFLILSLSSYLKST